MFDTLNNDVNSLPSCPSTAYDYCRKLFSDPNNVLALNTIPIGPASSADQQTINLLDNGIVFAGWYGYEYSPDLLKYWPYGKGKDVVFSSSAVDSYCNVPAVKNGIDQAVLGLMRSSLANGSASFPESGWQGHMRTNEVSVDKNPFHQLAGSPSGWHLAVDGADIRVAAYVSSLGKVTFEFQMQKYYAFNQSFSMSGMQVASKQSLQGLVDDGRADNYFITGISSPQTIDY